MHDPAQSSRSTDLAAMGLLSSLQIDSNYLVLENTNSLPGIRIKTSPIELMHFC